MSECKFDQQPLNCSMCGAFIGVLGTCEDFAICDNCNGNVKRARNDKAKNPGFDEVYSPQEESKYRYQKARVKR